MFVFICLLTNGIPMEAMLDRLGTYELRVMFIVAGNRGWPNHGPFSTRFRARMIDMFHVAYIRIAGATVGSSLERIVEMRLL